MKTCITKKIATQLDANLTILSTNTTPFKMSNSELTMTNFYTEAIALNNQGVAMIEIGNYALARSTFKMALSQMKSNVQGGSRKRQLVKDGDSAVSFRWSSSTPLTANRYSLESFLGSTFVYRRSLLIIPAKFYEKDDCYPETAAMLYNLSLSFHIEGQLTNNSTMLEKAMKAYNVALTIRKRRKVCRKLQRSDRLVDVAITNNMAMIYQEFMEFEKARMCFARMSRNVRSLSNSKLLEQTEYQGLVLNIMMGRQNQNTLAGAA